MKKTIEIEIPDGFNEVVTKTDSGLTVEFVKVDKEKEMKEFFKPFLTDLTLVTTDKYPNSVFYKKDGKVIFELEKTINTTYFWVDYDTIWKVLYDKFELNYTETQSFIKTQVEDTLKLQGITPKPSCITTPQWWKTL